jgi:hypothetical protein
MNLLFIGYWGVEEGITQATIIPHLKILTEFDSIEKIYYVSIEREDNTFKRNMPSDKIIHVPLIGHNSYLMKVYDFITHPSVLANLVKRENIQFVFCRGSMAGVLGYSLFNKCGIDFCVESFEPHADYMIESNVWKPWGMRYWFQRLMESKQLATAKFILTVTESYRLLLASREIDANKLLAMPCAVDLQKFKYDKNSRLEIRHELNIAESTVVGIYVGKFGGIYYGEEAFDIFKQAFEFFKNSFYLIILSGDDENEIGKKLNEIGIPFDRILLKKVPHDQVEKYLSASDFAFSTIRPASSRKYCSPIKNGEYWANGLPIVITEGVGDDSDIVVKEDGGITFDLSYPESLTRAFEYIKNKLKNNSRQERFAKISAIAEKHRNYSLVRKTYDLIIRS